MTEIQNNNNVKKSTNRIRPQKVLSAVVVVVLFLVLIFSYVSMFSSGFALGNVSYVGVINKEDFYASEFGDMVKIEKVEDIKKIQIGDVLVYRFNGEVGSISVSFVDYDKKIIYSKVNDVQKTFAFDIVLGRQVAKTPVLGAIVGFFASPAGVITVSAVLLLFLYLTIFVGANKEYTPEGKLLAKRLKKEKNDAKIRKQLIDNFRRTDGFSPEDSCIIDGSMGDNLIELVSYTNSGKQGSITDTFAYILDKVHSTYMVKTGLSKKERERISNVVEMFPIVDMIDGGMTFKLIDLILHESVIDFDVVGFEKLCLKFLSKNITVEDLSNFGSVLYVLLQKNKKMRPTVIVRIVKAYYNKVRVSNISQTEEPFQIALELGRIYALNLK